MELFSDNNILNSLSANQDINGHIYAEDYQYDLIPSYKGSTYQISLVLRTYL